MTAPSPLALDAFVASVPGNYASSFRRARGTKEYEFVY